MVKVKWKLYRGKVYLGLRVLGVAVYYRFPKRGHHKRFHPRSIFTRQINHSSYKDPFIPIYVVEAGGWVEEEIKDEVVKEKLEIQILTETEFYE